MQHRLYAITWDDAGRSHSEQVELLCRAGVGLIQLRMKSGSREERLHVAEHCLRICRQWGATLVINDDVELARQVLAPAIHLGLKDMSIADARKILGCNVLIGGTANTPEQVLSRLREGADYVGLGPWRFTGTKQNLSPVLGADGVQAAIFAAHQYKPDFPVFVIGGIKPGDCKEILELGARGVAVSSAIVCASNVGASVQEFSNALVGQGVRS
jgi:thiamine-phosphate pyrophosphorylase